MTGSPLHEKQLGIIGAGKMAEALSRGLDASGVVRTDMTIASDPDTERRELFNSLGIRAVEDNRTVVEEAHIIVLAVKPQQMEAVLSDIADLARPDHLFVSIAAGIHTSHIEEKLCEGARVIRVMPNTPLQVDRGASVLARGTHATDVDMIMAKAMFAASGLAMEAEEEQIDAVTAVSGSGPAYAFFLAECMIEAGIAEGLPPSTAKRLAAATIEGAGKYLLESMVEPSILRKRVTSPGGTTEAAFKMIDDASGRELIVSAIRRAAERSRELSGLT